MSVTPTKINGRVVEGKYDIRFYVKEGKGSKQIFLRVSADSLLHALTIENGLKKEYDIKPKNIHTVGAIWEKYLTYLRQNTESQKTMRDKQQCFMVSLLPFFGGMMPDKISSDDIEGYKKTRLIRSPGKNRQINKELIYLSAMINWAADKKRGLCNNRAEKYDKLEYTAPAR